MQKPSIIYLAPVKRNAVYVVNDKPKGGIAVAFEPIAVRLKEDRNLGRMIIFCQTYEDLLKIHHYFKRTLGTYYTHCKNGVLKTRGKTTYF